MGGGTKQKFLLQWAALGAALTILGAFVAYTVWSTRSQLFEQERNRLLSQSRVVAENLSAQLQAADSVLVEIREEVAKEDGEVLNHRLHVLERAIPGIRTLIVTDAAGTIRFSNRKALLRRSIASRNYFQAARTSDSSDRVYLTPPFRTMLGTWGMNLIRTIRDRDGRFCGVVAATLDQKHFQVLLTSVNYSPDMWSAIVHEDGIHFLAVPESADNAGVLRRCAYLVDRPGAVEVGLGIPSVSGRKQLLALRALKPRSLPLDKSLVVSVGRDVDAILSGWRQDSGVLLLSLAVVAAISVAALFLYQRRRKEFLRKAAAAEQETWAAHERLRQRERDLSAILDNMPSIIGYWDQNLRNRFGNRAYTSWLAVPDGEIGGKHMAEVIGEENFRLCLPHVEAALAGEAQVFERAVAVRGGSESRQTLVQYVPDVVDGEVRGFYAFLHDITAIKEAEAALLLSERQFRSAFHTAAHGMALFSLDGRWLKVNRALCDIVGLEEGELMATTVQGITDAADVEEDAARLQALVDGCALSCQVEKRLIHRDGHVVWALAAVSLVRDAQERPLHFVAQIQDISHRKETEAALRLAKEEAEAATRAKSEFLANMSHEVRTPMTAILGLTHLLLNDRLPPKQYDYLRKIHTSSKALMHILNDILDYSKIEAAGLTLERIPFSINEVVRNLGDLFGVKAEEKGIRLSIEVDPEVPPLLKGDPLRFGQVLNNLVGNALKFTDEGEVAVRLVAVERDPEVLLCVSICDTGIGIEPEQLERLFVPFCQADYSTTRRYGGTGLGLTIAGRIVELMGGEIGVESVPGKGSTFRFTITLPKAQPGEMEAEAPAPPVQRERGLDFAGARVLLVEDHPVNRQVALQLLLHEGCTVDGAETGREAVEMAARNPYAAIFMDLVMPEMGGVEAACAIRGGGAGAPPIIAMTAAATAEDREACLASGMSDYLAKPIDPEELHRTLLKWLPRQRVPLPTRRSSTVARAGGLPFTVAGFDLERAVARVAGNWNALRRALQSFRVDLEKLAAQVEGLLGRDPLEAARQLHNVKGAAGNLGCTALQAAAGRFEGELARGQRTVPGYFLQALHDALRDLQAGEQRWHEPPAVPFDEAQVQKSLAQLLPMLKGHRLVPSELVEELGALLEGEAEGELAHSLARQIESFDYPGALDSARAIAAHLKIELPAFAA